jgi:4-hydroxybenzoate polyprenyltransferase
MPTTPALLLLRAAHPRQALVTSLALGTAAAVSGRPLREVGLVAATVLVGQSILGWADDLADRRRDERHRPDKPLSAGTLDRGTVWFALACAVLLVVPLAVANGRLAGASYLALLVISAVGDWLLHARTTSFAPWMASFALYPAFLAYGGWNGVGTTTPPTPVMTALAAALGLGVHLLTALPGLVHDHEEGERSLPLVLALRTGTPRLLLAAGVFTGLVVVAMLIAGRTVGLT